MNKHDIIVVGASAGGLRALRMLFREFKPDLPAAVFVVLHVLPQGVSSLPEILQLQTDLPVTHAVDGEPIQIGHAYVAPPNRHLILELGHLHLSVGPRENRTRPAINPLFRSAALSYGSRVIGVILSGTLDDGTAGLWEIKRRHGITIVQQPDDAEYGQMPRSAIQNVPVNYQVPVADMGALIVSLVGQEAVATGAEVEHVMPANTNLTCPDCHGPIRRFRFGELTEYRCRVGHSFSPESMLAAHDDAEERALWRAVEVLEEGADLTEEMRGGKRSGNGLKRNGQAKRKLARTIRTAIEDQKLEREVVEDT